jgi:hypothetical protein
MENNQAPGNGEDVNNGEAFFTELKKETEVKGPGEDTAEKAAVKETDFEPEPEEAKPAEKEREAPGEKAKKYVSDLTASKITVDAFSFIQSLTFNAINAKKKRNRLGDDEDRAEELYYDIYVDKVKKITDLSPDEKKICRAYYELKKIDDRIEFEKEEIDEMTKNLEAIFHDSGFKMSPQYAMMLSLGKAMFIRVADAIGG